MLLQEFYADFAHIAEDESRHLGWCLQRLQELGYAYGDMPAHNMLWEGAVESSGEHQIPILRIGCMLPPKSTIQLLFTYLLRS